MSSKRLYNELPPLHLPSTFVERVQISVDSGISSYHSASGSNTNPFALEIQMSQPMSVSDLPPMVHSVGDVSPASENDPSAGFLSRLHRLINIHDIRRFMNVRDVYSRLRSLDRVTVLWSSCSLSLLIILLFVISNGTFSTPQESEQTSLINATQILDDERLLQVVSLLVNRTTTSVRTTTGLTTTQPPSRVVCDDYGLCSRIAR